MTGPDRFTIPDEEADQARRDSKDLRRTLKEFAKSNKKRELAAISLIAIDQDGVAVSCMNTTRGAAAHLHMLVCHAALQILGTVRSLPIEALRAAAEEPHDEPPSDSMN